MQLKHDSKRQDSLATNLMQLRPNDLMIFVRLSLKSRHYIKSFCKAINGETGKPIDLFFICEELNLSGPYNPPHYIAAFSWFVGANELVERALREIRYCQTSEICLLSVERVFTTLCETSFIEVDLFDRLGRADIKVIKSTKNPFVQTYLYKNVSFLTNLDSANYFIYQQLPLITNIGELLGRKQQLKPDQKRISKILFGTIRKEMVHLTEPDAEMLTVLSQQLRAYEVKNQQDMIDEDDQFENVSYVPFEEGKSESRQRVMLMSLRERRQESIRQMRDRLKEKERRLNRWDSSERIRL